MSIALRASMVFLDRQGKAGKGRRFAWEMGSPTTTIAIAALILLGGSIPAEHLGGPHPAARSTTYLPFSAGETGFRPASMGYSASQARDPPASANPTYDEQIGVTFTQNLTSISYNVTALAQVDASGYGPAYLINGLTAAGYWYQMGISYHWPSSSGTYDPTFGFSYQVYGPSGKAVFPLNGGAGLGRFSKAVHSGDSVLLSLAFSGTSVEMLAQDWNTGATAKTSYSSEGSSSFVGDASLIANSRGFFSGLMTEWYHDAPYTANVGKVTYTNQAVGLSSAWMWIDEFATGSSASPIFMDHTQGPVTFSNEQQIFPFDSHGVTMYGSAHQFITGLLNTASSRVSLTPATESAPPSFAASYTLSGLQQSIEVAAGSGTLVESDPGTSVTISVNSSGSSALERWVFGGSGGSAVTAVTFAAGSNVTYAYYHLLQETVAYQVVSPGKPLPAGSALELTYQGPPAVPSATPGQVAATQPLGTSPVEIFVLQGSDATLVGNIPGASGERWAASSQRWTVTEPNAIPNPIQFYDQYQVSIGFGVVGGGTPPEPPKFNSSSLGSPAVVSLSGTVTTTGWFDAGSGYSFSSLLNGTTAAERWVNSLLGNPGGGARLITSPSQTVTAGYVHQYHGNLTINDARGGLVSPWSGWFDAGSNFSASASANPQWQFVTWEGSGASSYSGASPSFSVTVIGPFSESATFFVQLSIAADSGTNIAFSYGSGAGTVQAGSTRTIYVPPSTNISLQASPSLFVYSFASWKGTGLANATKPSLSFALDNPSAVAGTSSYNYPVLSGLAAAAALIILAGSLWIRGRRKRASLRAFTPGMTPA